MNRKQKIAIAGLGKMGAAIARAAIAAGFEIYGYDPDTRAIQNLRNIQPEFKAAASFDELLQENIPLLLAVKPGQIRNLAAMVSDARLIISIAAGISISEIRNNRLTPGPIIRAMPNMPLVAGKGMTVLCASDDCGMSEREMTLSLFNAAGESFFIEDEKLMHVVTGISGSGPAYVYLFLQALEDAGVQGGLPRLLARKVALQTVLGAGEMCRITDRSPQDLVHDVTSPGGTTISALATLKEEKFETAIHKAVATATHRSEKLATEK